MVKQTDKMTEVIGIQELLRHGCVIAEMAGQIALDHFRGSLTIDLKSDDSPVTQADTSIETAVRMYLGTHFPDHGIYGEEHGADGLDKDYIWVVDPIDGTRSFLSGHPLFGFLLTVLKDGIPEIAIVAMPALNETFTVVRGERAKLNGALIAASGTTRLDQATIYVNEGDKIFQSHRHVFQRMLLEGRTRRFAYDCYPHALLAAGHVDAVVDYDLKPYDYLAISALIEAAGGIMTDWAGAPLTLESDGNVIAAATPQLHQELLRVLSG